MGIILFIFVGYLLLCYGLSVLFPKAGIEARKAWIPGVNLASWAEIIGRKPSYAWWFLFPIVNIFIYSGMAVDLARSFGQYRFIDSFLAVVAGPIYFIFLGRNPSVTYVGKTLELETAYTQKIEAAKKAGRTKELERLQRKNPYQKSFIREWTESLIFAVFAAAFIRMFLIEAFTIPTSSMEDNLMVGDYLFVSKLHYGMRSPQTLLQLPLLHNRIPFFQSESYLSSPSLPYYRFPAIESVDRNDAVVFNWPVGDSVFVLPSRTVDVGQARRMGVYQQYKANFPFVTRPMDKTDFYVKRCVAVAGDTIQLIDRQIHINGTAVQNPENLQYVYEINFNGGAINTKQFTEWNISQEDVKQFTPQGMVVTLTDTQRERIQSMIPKANISLRDMSKLPTPPTHFFPHDPKISGSWNYDNFGPIYVPKKGETIQITKENIAFYKRVISVYEGNDLTIQSDGIYINGEKTNEYTFKWDYFWMMGDNRHNSEDSRIWGFVPETHIVGKPLFIFFSTVEGALGNGIRWNRIFKSADISLD